VGRSKVESARDAISRLNPHVRVAPHHMRLDAGNARALVAGYDIVADGSDNFATRYLVSDSCFYERKPLVAAAVGGFDASLTTLRPFDAGPDGRPNPTYRCLFPEPPPPGTTPSCEEAGVLGALTGIVGAMMALEVVREIVGFGEGLVGRLLLIDTMSVRYETLRYAWDPENPLSGVTAPR
jgi:adenylyltransferase/sulfurtransferase